jgi:hypothetical protein
VRGGAGLFDVLPLPYQYFLLTTLPTPFFQATAIVNPGTGTFFNNLPPLPANSLGATYIEPNPKRNYVAQWNLNVQHQFTPTLTSMIAYVGSRGIHQPYRVDDADLVMPTLTPAGYLYPQVDAGGNLISGPNAGNPPSRINENFGGIRGMFYEGRSYYNHVKRISENFNIQFRAEIFNLLNHANFAPPITPDNTDIFDATGTPTGVAGLLSRTTTTAREIQFAIKIIF